MRTLTPLFSLLMLVLSMVLYSGCKDDATVKPLTDKQIKLLKGSWKATEVKADAIPQDHYNNFVLTLSGEDGNTTIQYTVEGRPFVSPWPDSGTFSFDDANPENILHRDDDVMITYEVTQMTLTLSFNFSGETYVNGRSAGVTGDWQFKFDKQ